MDEKIDFKELVKIDRSWLKMVEVGFFFSIMIGRSWLKLKKIGRNSLKLIEVGKNIKD